MKTKAHKKPALGEIEIVKLGFLIIRKYKILKMKKKISIYIWLSSEIYLY